MSDTVLKAITVKSLDYKDNDKLVRFFTPTGMVVAQVKGVRKANAKLKFCAQPFCFSEIVVHESKGFNTVTGADLIDSFFDIAQDYESYLAGCAVIEALDAVSGNFPDAMVLVLRTFSALLEGRPYEFLIKYLLEMLKLVGYGVGFTQCVACRKPSMVNYWFNFDDGMVCTFCRGVVTPNQRVVSLPAATQSALRIIEITSADKLATVKLNKETLRAATELLAAIFKHKCGVEIKSLTQF